MIVLSKLRKNGKKLFKKINFKKKVSELRNRFIETLDLPQELSGQCVRITMIQNMQILIEGKNNIIDYYDNYIKLQAQSMYLQIDGTNLKIAEITDQEALITGNISNVGFINR